MFNSHDAVRKHNAVDRSVGKHTVFKHSQAGRQHHFTQRTIKERAHFDGRNAVRQNHLTNFPVHAGICMHCGATQDLQGIYRESGVQQFFIGNIEHLRQGGRVQGWESQVFDGSDVVQYTVTHVLHRSREFQRLGLGQTAISKRIVADFDHCLIAHQDIQLCALERRCADILQLSRHNEFGHTAVGKRVFIDTLQLAVFGELQIAQRAAAVESIVANLLDTIRDRNGCQADIVIERSLVNTAKLAVVRKGHRRQALTFCECIIVDALHTIRNRHCCQVVAVEEHAITQSHQPAICGEDNFIQQSALESCKGQRRYGVRQGVTAGLTCGERDQLRHGFVVQHTIDRSIVFVIRRDGDLLQILAGSKAELTHIFHTGRQEHFFQATTIKCVGENLQLLCAAHIHTGQAGAGMKCVVIDFFHTCRQSNCLQCSALKGITANLRQCGIFSKGDFFQRTVLECVVSDRIHTLRNGDGCKVLGICKDGSAQVHQAAAFCKADRCDATTLECAVIHNGHCLGNRDSLQGARSLEGILIDALQGIRQHNRLHSSVIRKGITADGNDLIAIHGSQFHMGFRACVGHNTCLAVAGQCVLPITGGDHLRCGYIVAVDAVIPVFIQVQRQHAAMEVDV